MKSAVDAIYQLLQTIPDPEVPVITIVELGIIRDVQLNGSVAEITITPTYTGCPAMYDIEKSIIQKLTAAGYTPKIISTLSPAWTTDWITEEAKEKLRVYGIAPPEKTTANKKSLLGIDPVVKCPQCKSSNTRMISQFGSTACKALYACNDCLEPFDYFKCL